MIDKDALMALVDIYAQNLAQCAMLGKPHAEDAELAQSRAAVAEQVEVLGADAERLDWLDQQGEAYGFESEHHGNRWVLDGPFRSARVAIDAAIAAQQGKETK